MSVREMVVSRGTVGAGILAGHVVLVAFLISAGVIRTSTIVPEVSVTFVQQEEKRAERPDVAEPILSPLHQVLVPPPEVVVAFEPNSMAIAATVVETPPPPPAAPAPSSGTASIPEMSEVAYLVQPAPHYPPESRRIH